MTVRFIWGEHPVSLQLHCISSTDRAALRGLRCPECRHPLIPVHPAARAKHFRHAIDSSCSGGLETVAHRVAKQILCDGLTLMLPERTCHRWPHPSGRRTSEILAPLSAVSVIGGRQEVTLASGHRADVICDAQRRHRQIRPLLVEVCVHHSVDDAKAAALREADHHAIEIDVPEALALMPLAQARDYLSRSADRRWLTVDEDQDDDEGRTRLTLSHTKSNYSRWGKVFKLASDGSRFEILGEAQAERKKPTGPRLTTAQQVCLKALNMALDHHGESHRVTPAHIEKRCVSVEEWRTHAYRMGVTDREDQDSRRRAFFDTRKALIAKGLVGCDEPWAWAA